MWRNRQKQWATWGAALVESLSWGVAIGLSLLTAVLLIRDPNLRLTHPIDQLGVCPEPLILNERTVTIPAYDPYKAGAQIP